MPSDANKPLRIVCVSVENYCGMGAAYVNALYRGVTRNCTLDFVFTCFTDDPHGLDSGIDARKLPSGINGWWNKIALFHPKAFEDGERVLYFDLDTVIVRNIDDVAGYDGAFAGIGDVYRPGAFGSGVMAWVAGRYSHIWEAWEAFGYPNDPYGDQGFIERCVPVSARLDRCFPGKLVSYKAHCRAIGRVPGDASVVFFHGHPRPHECSDEWVDIHWRQYATEKSKQRMTA